MKYVAKQIKINHCIVVKRRNFLSRIRKHPVYMTLGPSLGDILIIKESVVYMHILGDIISIQCLGNI